MSFIDRVKKEINPVTPDQFNAVLSKRGGLAKGNRFSVFLCPPQQSLLNLDLQTIGANLLSGTFSLGGLVNDPRDIGVLCDEVSFPGRQITTLEYQTWNFAKKVPNGFITENVDMTFHLTNDYYMKKMFDRWIALVMNFDSNQMRYKSKYVSDITIQQLNEQNTAIYGMKLHNAFPVTVQSIPLANSATDATQKLVVQFAFDKFEPEGALSSVLSGIKSSIGGITRLL